MTPTLKNRIEATSEGLYGLLTSLFAVTEMIGEETMIKFLEKVPEKGEALWLRFRSYQKEKAQTGFEAGFEHFVASVVYEGKMPF